MTIRELVLFASELTAPPNGSGTPLIIYIFGAMLAGGAVPAALQHLRNRRRGPIEDEQLISQMVENQVGSMKTLLDQYKVEVEVNRRQLEDYRIELREMTRDLARAQLQISQLEERLDGAREARTATEAELTTLRADYKILARERSRVIEQLAELRRQLETPGGAAAS